jgi:hypothetical protein
MTTKEPSPATVQQRAGQRPLRACKPALRLKVARAPWRRKIDTRRTSVVTSSSQHCMSFMTVIVVRRCNRPANASLGTVVGASTPSRSSRADTRCRLGGTQSQVPQAVRSGRRLLAGTALSGSHGRWQCKLRPRTCSSQGCRQRHAAVPSGQAAVAAAFDLDRADRVRADRRRLGPADARRGGAARRASRSGRTHQRSTRDPRAAPAAPVSTMPSVYQTATNAGEGSGQASE